jgi:hypothetical protein
MKTDKIKVDALKFQKQLKEILNKKLEQAKKNINESEYFIDDEEDPDNKPDEGPEKVEDGLDFTTVSDEDDQTAEEHKIVLEVQSKAEELDAEILGYQHGVFHIEFDSKDSANSFKDFIEEYDPVDTFEFKTLDESSEESGEGDETEDGNDFRFWVYLDPKKVSFDYFDIIHGDSDEDSETHEEHEASETPEEEAAEHESDDEDKTNLRKESFKKFLGKKHLIEEHDTEEDKSEEMETETPDEDVEEKESEDEVKPKKVKSKKHPKTRIKTTCKPGYKYNHETGACEEVKDDELKEVRKKVRKHLAKKHSENKPEAPVKTSDDQMNDDMDAESEVSEKPSKADKFED